MRRTKISIREWAQFSQAILTSLAIIAAAVWFFLQNSMSDRVSLNLEVDEVPINRQFSLVRVKAEITNNGLIKMQFKQRKFAILKVSPPEPAVLTEIEQFSIDGRFPKVHPLGAAPVTLRNDGYIYPGEKEHTSRDFVLLRCVSSIIVEFAMCSRHAECMNENPDTSIYVWDVSRAYKMKTYLGDDQCLHNEKKQQPL